MPGQRRHQQHARLHGGDVLFEMQERAERRGRGGLLMHLDFTIADGDGVDAEGRTRVRKAGPRDQLVDRGEIAHAGWSESNGGPPEPAAMLAQARTGLIMSDCS